MRFDAEWCICDYPDDEMPIPGIYIRSCSPVRNEISVMPSIHGRIRTYFLTIGCILLCSSFQSEVHATEPMSLLEQFLPAREVEESGEIETDRDSFTPATTLVSPSRIMIESAWSIIDNRDVAETNSLPELVIRYGASDWLELRFGTNYEIGGESSDVSGSEGTLGERMPTEESGIEEEANVSYGLKIDVTDQEYWIPDSAVILTGITPTSGSETATRFVGTYVFGWELENGWVWDSAIRYGTSGTRENSTESWAPSTVVKMPVTERAKAHVECFSIFTNGPQSENEKHYISPGIHYLINEDLEVGIRVGWGLNQDAANFFSNIGFGWQF